ncbi:hypothetical protein [Rhizobium skierniewicense]|uniref:hypothetical protein n=1 Tax=Rhizobium skierniewicense TaxID=984260 RepID=UPI001574A21A|nr:hypothetical protein [Rhizobium skierniewicense]NTF34462.1 hypothetical protein [Rhizobium skierniewicense]
MKHISIIGKFLIIMAAFGLFSLGMALYSGQQIKNIDASYSELLSSESSAALYMARSNRAMQAFRASVGDLLLSRSAEAKVATEKELQAAEASFIKSMDTAIAALPAKPELPLIKADVLRLRTY